MMNVSDGATNRRRERTWTTVEPDEEFGRGGDVFVLDEMEIKVGVGSGVLDAVDGRGGG